MSTLILIRHGQSEWNKANLFTGWVNVPLSEQGYTEAKQAGIALAQQPIDLVFTSTLIRAQHTAVIVMTQHESKRTPILMQAPQTDAHQNWGCNNSPTSTEQSILMHCDWHLNERYYGDLQGMNKDEARQQFGKEQVHIWRRSFDVPPPNGESLKMTAERTIPYFKQHILTALQAGKNILVSAHGNSLRSIVMELEQLSEEAVLQLEIATGDPRRYSYTDNTFTRID